MLDEKILTPQEKRKELLAKKAKYQEKLKFLYSNFRGVRHESSSDEIKYTQIKVYEGFVASINEELEAISEEING